MSMVAMAGSVSGATVRTQKRVWGLCTGCSVGVAAGKGGEPPVRRGDSLGTVPQCHPVATAATARHPSGCRGVTLGVPRGCGYRRWELEHLGGKRVIPRDGGPGIAHPAWA